MNPRLRQAIDAAAATLAAAGIASARTDAELLAAHVGRVERGRLLTVDPPEQFYGDYDAAVRARATRMPLQHITGNTGFGPLTLHVGPGVFIPRPETEAMLEWALAQQLSDTALIVDLCTGSAALAAALAHARPRARVIGIDDDPRALGYAAVNTEGTRVELVRADVSAAVLLPDIAGTVDLVVANPPYIPEGTVLEPEVAQHDPQHALFGGADGMALIGPIAAHAARWLRPGGLLAIEHDDTTSAQTVATVAATGAFGDVTAHPDLTGRPRFVTARRTPRTETP